MPKRICVPRSAYAPPYMKPAACIPRLLSIAGSDSGGGAGIQADLKAFAACGAHGMTAITAITAQSTVGVSAVHNVPPETILAQVRAVAGDIGVDAVKVGMLGSEETIEAVARALDELPEETPVVLDPVMVAESGAELLAPSARAALIELLLPRASVVTPNLLEALALGAVDLLERARSRALSGREAGPRGDRVGPRADEVGPRGEQAGPRAGAVQNNFHEPDVANLREPEIETLARAILALGPRAVVITGGHRDRAIDVFFDGATLAELPGERHPGGAAHGSGCTHSSVLAASLARGEEPLQAARRARKLAGVAVRDGLSEIGSGPGPVNVLGLAHTGWLENRISGPSGPSGRSAIRRI